MPSLSYRPTHEDLLDACRLHDYGVVLGWRMLSVVSTYTVGVGALVTFVLSLSYGPLTAGLAGSGIALSLSAVLLALRHMLLPLYLVRRQLREQPAYQGEWELTWSERGYGVRADTVSSDVSWGHYVRWRENGRVILLYQTWQAYQFVPKRVLPPEGEQFIRTQLQVAGVPKAYLLPLICL